MEAVVVNGIRAEISIPLRYNLELKAYAGQCSVAENFNSTKVQFGELANNEAYSRDFISIPLRYNLESGCIFVVAIEGCHFNSTKVQFGV